ncbi:hypothetical protein F511_06277 [Dorcoceras hygrometricum]|uniref:Uncharacterized protein n=1 Tax=Dorcoceras hygrometricum TaxID=472368 RepID=A0A2Z7B4P7_9LAMI|nr:hypothetical protein F511_06277 [Dorcoceras hygrometricum]
MVRLLANIIRRGVAPFPAAGSTASGSFYQSVLRFSTNVPDDTHEDFKPTIKTESSGIVIKDIVEQDLKENPVMIYMKGVPDLPRCGFSALALKWGFADVPLSARNILEDLELKNAVKSFRKRNPVFDENIDGWGPKSGIRARPRTWIIVRPARPDPDRERLVLNGVGLDPENYFSGPGWQEIVEELTQNDRPGLPPAPEQAIEAIPMGNMNPECI